MKNKELPSFTQNNPMGCLKFRFFYACLDAGIKDNKKYISDLYLSGLSSPQIQEHFKDKYKIETSVRNIQGYLKKMGITRTSSEAKILSIKTKRHIYRKKPEHEKYHHKFISHLVRMQILQRDAFKCQLCGNGTHNGSSVEIHHKDFNPKNNNLNNLQTLCHLCHRGLHATKTSYTNTSN